jgi:hypothetical protein
MLVGVEELTVRIVLPASRSAIVVVILVISRALGVSAEPSIHVDDSVMRQ